MTSYAAQKNVMKKITTITVHPKMHGLDLSIQKHQINLNSVTIYKNCRLKISDQRHASPGNTNKLF